MARNAPCHGARRSHGRRPGSPQTTPSCSPGRNSSARQPRLRRPTTVSWQLRRRVINTLLVVLFVYRLMFSGNGYTATLAALWEQCRACGIPLPQAEPVAASSMSAARAKVDEAIFKNLHAEILKRAESSQWKGHRVFAVDGSKINLPRPLLRAGYPLPQERAHYPQGLLSCLYELGPKLPIDFDLHAHGDERAAALAHLPAMAAGDVVVYDRGYYSYRDAAGPCAAGPASAVSVCREMPEPHSTTSSQEAGRMSSSPSHRGPDTLRRLGPEGSRGRTQAHPPAARQIRPRRNRVPPRNHPSRPKPIPGPGTRRPLP